MMWTQDEEQFLRSLSSPAKIQIYLDQLIYNPSDFSTSPRYVMMTQDAHCFEGCLFAAAALELQGHKPLLVHFQAHNDDYHTITVYREKTGWGAISKSNTTLLAGRKPFYRTIRELVMSYFDFYFNTEGHLSLYAYTAPINLNKYNHWDWRRSDDDLLELGKIFSQLPHFETTDLSSLKKSSQVTKRVMDACFLGADPDGLYGLPKPMR